MLSIHFAFIGEGTSDDGLIPHLEDLCVALGADEVTGTAIDFQRFDKRIGNTIKEKLNAAIQLEPNANLWFVHRDADSRDPKPRYDEVSAAIVDCAFSSAWVAVIPVQETEAWLLLDETAIRTIAGRPSGRTPALNLPNPGQVESKAKPKEFLQETLVRAAGVTGRRLRKFVADFPVHRKLLLQRLPTKGYLEDVTSWRRMRTDLKAAIDRIRETNIALMQAANETGITDSNQSSIE
jgi:hypothetical protein